MSLKGGHCLDEIMYRDLDDEVYARHLHSKCNHDGCDCPNHDLTECANGDTVQMYHKESEDKNNG